MFKTLKKFRAKKDNICARAGCNNQIKRERNGTEYNYCSQNCQMSNYAPGSNEFYGENLETPPYTSSTSSNQWGVWTPNQDDAPPSYSSINKENDIFGSLDDNTQVTPLWEDEDPPSNTSNSRYSSSRPTGETDDFPLWYGASTDPLWTPVNSSRNYSPPATPRSGSPSDEGEINCPKCTFFIRSNKTVCEMCGESITRPEPKRSYKSPSKPSKLSSSRPKTTISTYRDLYEDDEDEDDNPFADPSPRRNNRHSSSSDNYGDSTSSKSRNQSYSSSHNYRDSPSTKSRNQSYSYSDDYEDSLYSQSRNRHSSRNRTSTDYNPPSPSPTPPNVDELWINEEDTYFESVPTRRPPRQKPPPKPYTTPSFFREAERRSNVTKPPTPPTPPLKEKQEDQITCIACNFNNHKSMTHCEICYTQLNKATEKKERNTSFSRIEETRAKKACTACSFYNDADRVQCEMCYSPIAETVRRSPFNILPSFFSHDVNMTQCLVCTFMNHPSMAQCEMCRNTLPGGNLKQQQDEYNNILDNSPGPITKLIQLPKDNHDFMNVQQQFKVGVPNANILAIFKVTMPARLVQAHDAYKKQIAGNNPVANVTHRMFHGTHVACDAKRFYGPPGWGFCAAIDCGLCGISKNGNSCAKSKHGGRMWFANNSATSLGYCRTDPIKAMFILDIISATGGGIIIVDKEAATLAKFLIIFQ